MKEPLVEVAVAAAELVASGNPDQLVVLVDGVPTMPGEQGDDDIRADAAINILRYFVAEYEAEVDGGALVERGWWHPNVKSGQVHEHAPIQPRTMHRLCVPIYTRGGLL